MILDHRKCDYCNGVIYVVNQEFVEVRMVGAVFNPQIYRLDCPYESSTVYPIASYDFCNQDCATNWLIRNKIKPEQKP